MTGRRYVRCCGPVLVSLLLLAMAAVFPETAVCQAQFGDDSSAITQVMEVAGEFVKTGDARAKKGAYGDALREYDVARLILEELKSKCPLPSPEEVKAYTEAPDPGPGAGVAAHLAEAKRGLAMVQAGLIWAKAELLDQKRYATMDKLIAGLSSKNSSTRRKTLKSLQQCAGLLKKPAPWHYAMLTRSLPRLNALAGGKGPEAVQSAKLAATIKQAGAAPPLAAPAFEPIQKGHGVLRLANHTGSDIRVTFGIGATAVDKTVPPGDIVESSRDKDMGAKDCVVELLTIRLPSAGDSTRTIYQYVRVPSGKRAIWRVTEAAFALAKPAPAPESETE